LIWSTLFYYYLSLKTKKEKKKRQIPHEPIFTKDELWGNTGLTSFLRKVTKQIILEIMSSHLMEKKVI